MLYTTIFIFQMPGLLLLAGALVKVLRLNSRLHRLQLEGAAMLTTAMLARWVIFDHNFGIDRYEETLWSYWFDRAEPGLFWMGLLFLMLGFFLERRPRPGLRKWPWAGKAIAGLAILAGAGLSLFASGNVGLAFLDIPFAVSRLLFLLGLFPFCIGYLRTALRQPDPAPVHLNTHEED
jgi:hypothetical protein